MNKAILIILDGWGLGQVPASDAIRAAHTPVFDHLLKMCPNSTLITYGEDVGLPHGQMGNSEVGHINIGAGRIVFQDILRIDKDIQSGDFQKRPVLQEILHQAGITGRRLHLMGLLSDGGVHSHIDHLLTLCDLPDLPENTYIHAFLDGRDTDPHSGVGYLQRLLEHIEDRPVEVATVVGRYFAMDRDKRWDRTYKAYRLLVNGLGEQSDDVIKTVNERYEEGQTDEFMEPITVDENGTIRPDDVVLWFNFRADRPRQLTEMLAINPIAEVGSEPLDILMASMTPYDERFSNKVRVLYDKDHLEQTFGQLIAEKGLTQLRTAETEKYPHVTYFFNGGREAPFEREHRILVDSPKVATYDLTPSMSAMKVKDQLLAHVRDHEPAFICLNFANTDMVGHTGVFKAAKEAAESVDLCLGQIIEVLRPLKYHMLIIADHGNADMMINPDGRPNTAHTMNPVPCIYVNSYDEYTGTVSDGRLCDVAVTLAHIMNLEPYDVMTGKNLLSDE